MSAGSYLGRMVIHDPVSQAEMEAMRRKAWLEHGYLSLSHADDRLTWEQREYLKQIAERLYGKRERTRP